MDRDSNELSHDGEITFKQNVLFAQVHSSSTKYLYRYNKTTLVIIFRTTTERNWRWLDDDFQSTIQSGKIHLNFKYAQNLYSEYRSVLHVERAYELQEHSASFALFQGLKTLYLNVISFRFCLFCQGRRMFLRGCWIERYLWAPRWGFINVTLGLIFSR